MNYLWNTLNDGQQNNNDEKEEGDIEENAVNFIVVTIRRLNFVTDTTTSSDALSIKVKWNIDKLDH